MPPLSEDDLPDDWEEAASDSMDDQPLAEGSLNSRESAATSAEKLLHPLQMMTGESADYNALAVAAAITALTESPPPAAATVAEGAQPVSHSPSSSTQEVAKGSGNDERTYFSDSGEHAHMHQTDGFAETAQLPTVKHNPAVQNGNGQAGTAPHSPHVMDTDSACESPVTGGKAAGVSIQQSQVSDGTHPESEALSTNASKAAVRSGNLYGTESDVNQDADSSVAASAASSQDSPSVHSPDHLASESHTMSNTNALPTDATIASQADLAEADNVSDAVAPAADMPLAKDLQAHHTEGFCPTNTPAGVTDESVIPANQAQEVALS